MIPLLNFIFRVKLSKVRKVYAFSNCAVLTLVAFYSAPGFSAASCVSQGDYSLATQNVIVQRDAPVGTELSRAEGSVKSLWICTGQTTWHQIALYGSNPHSMTIDGKTIFSTNLSGVGYALGGEMNDSDFKYAMNGSDMVLGWGTNGLVNGGIESGRATIIFYKTGTAVSGEVNTPVYGTFNSDMTAEDEPADSIKVLASSFKVVSLACSINTPALNFTLGDIPANTFSTTTGPVPWIAENTQNLGLNCDADANINVSLSGTQNPDVTESTVLALTGQGETGIAKGVGVQLVYNGTPLEFDKNIVLKRSAGGQEVFPIVARYYQTKSSVMPGKADASATLNILYQ